MKILLVEDNEILAKGLIYSLEQKKYQVIHTLNVENTLKILKTEKIDLAILDVSLPDGNGFDLYRIILRNKKNTIIQVQNIKFDMDKMVVYRDNENVELTNLELKILNLLFLNLNKVVKRSEIIDKIWEWTGNDVNDNTVTVYLKRIREKIKTDIIITIKGIGYRIDSEVY